MPSAAKRSHRGAPVFPRFVVTDDDAVRGLRAVERRGRRALHDLDVLDLFRIQVVEESSASAADARLPNGHGSMLGLPFSTRTPSTITSGSFDSERAERCRELRTRDPPPTVPFDWISVTPAVRPFSTSCIAVIGCSCTSFAVSIFAIELPSSRVVGVPSPS